MDEGVAPLQPKIALVEALDALKRDLSKLSLNFGAIDHAVETDCNGLRLRLHYPLFRQSKPMVSELIDAVSMYIVNFCLPRNQVADLESLYGTLSVPDFLHKFEAMRQEAYDLFKRAHIASNRNGEAGELILFLLTEWLLEAPQIIAKMSLKTNREMPVHGSDGVHVRYCQETARLYVYWGEAKLYKDINLAIAEAAKSIADSLTDEKIKHEISLVKRHLDFAGLSGAAKNAMLDLLDPFGSEYVNRHDVISCLIVFDFEEFATAEGMGTSAESGFRELALKKLEAVAPSIASALAGKGMAYQAIEMFIIPVPSVARLRELFQNKIGWKPPAFADDQSVGSTKKTSGKKAN